MSEERMQFQNANLSRSVFSLSFSLQAEARTAKITGSGSNILQKFWEHSGRNPFWNASVQREVSI